MDDPRRLDPSQAIERLLGRIDPVEARAETSADAARFTGRVLAEPLRLDRDSPACDVSAMDGYAVRLKDLVSGPIPIAGECRIGEPPATLPTGEALRIYTGSPLPAGADTVVRLERATEADGRLRLNDDASIDEGQDIRRGGENSGAGTIVLGAGAVLTPAAIGAVATVGATRINLRRPLRIAVLTTGNELVTADESDADEPLAAWRLRDSNGPTLEAMFAPLAWVGSVEREHVADSLEALTERLAKAVATADAVVLTGGVSKGAYDHVPDAVARVGGEPLFHGLNARPGRPTLGAMADGVPVLGLPGNPLAVLSTARRIVAPVLRHRAGLAIADPPAPTVRLVEGPYKTSTLTWWRPVRLVGPGEAQLAAVTGSGDTCGPAASDGFVEVPPQEDGTGPYAYHAWSL